MPSVRINPTNTKSLIAHVLTEMAARQERESNTRVHWESDICDWAEEHFFIPNTGLPIVLPLHQKAVLRFAFTRRENGHFPYQNIIYSAIKKSGKSTTAGLIARWFAETQTRYGEIYTIGNDLEQAKGRSYKEVARSIQLTPGYNRDKDILPGRWQAQKLSLRCYLTGSIIHAVAVDAKGEAGGQQAMTVWTELWGAENEEAKRFWDEMPPINTVPDSLRIVETYAGYDGESELLHGLYIKGLEGHQMTAGELASFVCRPGVEGEEFDDYVNAWHETGGDPEVLIPVYYNDAASQVMYWDDGLRARRMPWQHMFEPLSENEDDQRICGHCRRLKSEHDAAGLTADQYYQSEEENARSPQAFRRLHLNEWVSAESAFVPMESWDACGHVHEIAPLRDGETTPQVVGADAAVTGDCFGIVSVNRCPIDPSSVDIRALRKWDPAESGGIIQLDQPEFFLRGCCKVNNVVQMTYDPYQMENMAQRLKKDGVCWVSPFIQSGERLKADSQLYDMIINRQIHYYHADGCPAKNHADGSKCECMIAPLREHISNANSKVQVNEDSKIRIVKKATGKKIDLTVALSMAVARCLHLRLENSGGN